MRKSYIVKSARSLFVAILIAMLMMSLVPMQLAQAQEPGSSDLVLKLVSIPKHVKACQLFEAIYTVTNFGPDTAYYLSAWAGLPDAFDFAEIVGLPESLAVGESATFKVVIKVTGFVPGEIRHAWVITTVSAGSFLEPNIDPNPENNSINTEMKIIGKHSMEWCPR